MRNAEQIRRDAERSGTYVYYLGDGASVPWELVVYPANYLLYTYKIYLDSRWPEAFRLHDWCYTPYGAMIGVYKLEADTALWEEINRDSPVDAWIVFNAVRLGPEGQFGSSFTGYPNPPRRNMGLAPTVSQERKWTMPTKCVMLFKDVMGGQAPAESRVAGWSESLYHPSDTISEVLMSLRGNTPTQFGGNPFTVVGLLPARAALLPASSSIIGVKLYKGGTGKGASSPAKYPGNSAWPTDIPQMALQLACKSGSTGATRRWRIHAVPDTFVVQGIYQPSNEYSNALTNYFNALTGFGFNSRPAQVGFNITTIVQIPPVAPATASVGLVTTIQPHSFVVGDQVTIYSTELANTHRYTVTKRVVSVVAANQVTVDNWTVGNTVSGVLGSPLKTFDQFALANISIGLITVVKVGRPSDLYRGRRSKRR